MGAISRYAAKKVTPGQGSGPALVVKGRLGLRGFADPQQGVLKGGMGDLEGAPLGGAVLIFTSSKGSTTWSMTLDLVCRHGHVPAAMVITQPDSFVALGCVLQGIPLVLVEDARIFDKVKTNDAVFVDADKQEVIVNRSE